MGLYYENLNAPLQDWQKIKAEFLKLSRDERLNNQLSVRYVPHLLFQQPSKVTEFENKYKFHAILKVSMSPSLISPEKHVYNFEINTHMKRKFSSEEANTIESVVNQISSKESDVKNLIDFLELTSHRTFNLLLMFLGVQQLVSENRHDAVIFLKLLEQRLHHEFRDNDENFKIGKEPRRSIRYWIARSMILRSNYPGDEPPKVELLDEIIDEANTAIEEFGKEFPILFNTQARNLYYALRLDEALSMLIKQLKSHSNLTLLNEVNMVLNIGVLALFLNEWGIARIYLEIFKNNMHKAKYDWEDLIGFADFAYDYQHKDAIFLRYWYRKLANFQISEEIEVEFEKWINGNEHKKFKRIVNLKTIPKSESIRVQLK